MRLDTRGLLEARRARDEAWPRDNLEPTIRAYLDTIAETTAMDRIEVAKAIYHATPRNKPFERLSAFKRERILAEADAFLASLSAAGYRVIGPDELDPVTLEKAAEAGKEAAKVGDCHHVAAAIRALRENGNA